MTRPSPRESIRELGKQVVTIWAGFFLLLFMNHLIGSLPSDIGHEDHNKDSFVFII